MYKYVLMLHILAATVWTGGHLVLTFTILPKALKERAPEIILNFESRYERIGIPLLLIQVVTGLWLAHRLLPDVGAWFSFESYASSLIVAKLGLLALTAAFAVDARLRIIPKLSEKNLKALAYHIVPVTVIAVLFVIVGVGFRTGGLF